MTKKLQFGGIWCFLTCKQSSLHTRLHISGTRVKKLEKKSWLKLILRRVFNQRHGYESVIDDADIANANQMVSFSHLLYRKTSSYLTILTAFLPILHKFSVLQDFFLLTSVFVDSAILINFFWMTKYHFCSTATFETFCSLRK